MQCLNQLEYLAAFDLLKRKYTRALYWFICGPDSEAQENFGQGEYPIGVWPIRGEGIKETRRGIRFPVMTIGLARVLHCLAPAL